MFGLWFDRDWASFAGLRGNGWQTLVIIFISVGDGQTEGLLRRMQSILHAIGGPKVILMSASLTTPTTPPPGKTASPDPTMTRNGEIADV